MKYTHNKIFLRHKLFFSSHRIPIKKKLKINTSHNEDLFFKIFSFASAS